MSEVRSRNLRLVLRYLLAQICCAAAAAIAAAAVSGAVAGRAALAGGVIVATGNAVFGWRLFAPGVAPVRELARGLYAGAALKWLWLLAALGLALGPAGMPPLPLLAGVLAAQAGFWIGMAVIR